MQKIFVLFLSFTICYCTKPVDYNLQKLYVLDGALLSGFAPYLRLNENNKNGSRFMDLNEYEAILWDNDNPALKLKQNARFIFEVKILPGHSYTLEWKLKTEPDWHVIKLNMPPAFTPNEIENPIRTDVISAKLNVESPYEYALQPPFGNGVFIKASDTFNYVSLSVRSYFYYNFLFKSNSNIQIWPPITSYGDELWCPQFVNRNFKFNTNSKLVKTNKFDKEMISAFSAQYTNRYSPFNTGNKIQAHYSKGIHRAFVICATEYNKPAFEFMPTKFVQSVTIKDKNNNVLKPADFEIINLKVLEQILTLGWAEKSKIKSKSTFEDLPLFDIDVLNNFRDLNQKYRFTCDLSIYDPYEFAFEITLKDKNLGNINKYTFNNLIYEPRDKIHEVQLY